MLYSLIINAFVFFVILFWIYSWICFRIDILKVKLICWMNISVFLQVSWRSQLPETKLLTTPERYLQGYHAYTRSLGHLHVRGTTAQGPLVTCANQVDWPALYTVDSLLNGSCIHFQNSVWKNRCKLWCFPLHQNIINPIWACC